MLLCEQQRVDLSLSRKKWLIFSLKVLIDQLPSDSLYGPLRLNEFWNEWGGPDGEPNVIQGVNNQMGPSEFYSDENLKNIVSEHKSWLESELKKIVLLGARPNNQRGHASN